MEFLNKIAQSFFSPHFYNTAARGEKGIGGKFILALTILTLLALAVQFGGGPTGVLAAIRGMPAVVRTFPAMTMKGGQLSIDKPVPYAIKLGSSGLQIVIDTNYKMTDVSTLKEKIQNENIVMMLTQDAFVAQSGNGELRVQDFKTTQDFIAGHDQWEGLAQWLEGQGIPIIIISLVAGSALILFIYNLVATFLAAIVVTVIGVVLRASLEFDASMRLAAGARLPATLISLLPFIRPGVGWLIWGAYLIFAVAACRAAPSQPAPQK